MTIAPVSRNIDNALFVVIDGKNLQQVHKYEYLGVVMDDKLCMNSHINHIVKKVQGRLSTLRKFRRHITATTALRIYKGLMLCHLDYGDFVVESGNKENIDRLDKLQNRSLRCIEYCLDATKHMTLNELYHKYNVEPLSQRRERNLLKIMYGESKNIGNIDMYRPTMVLRSNNTVKMHHKFTKITKIQKSPYYVGLLYGTSYPRSTKH